MASQPILEPDRLALSQLRLTRVGRQMWDRYGTPEKLANAIRLEQSIQNRAEQIDAFPWRVILEPISVCNLKCPGCAGHEGPLSRGTLSQENVEEYLKELWPYLVQVNLFNWGEPLLNKRIDKIIRMVHDRGVGTQIHSNLNHMPADIPQRLVESGLDFIVVSIDGVTQETYEIYRKAGEVELAFANLRQLLEIRNKLGSTSPRVIWRFLCFPHNLHELDAAREMARQIGVDDLAIGEGRLHGQTWTPDGAKPAEIVPSEPPMDDVFCRDMYDFPVIHYDGTMFPCCIASDASMQFGNLTTDRWQDAFNTPAFRAARRLSAGDLDVQSPCRSCEKMPTAKLSLPQLRVA